MNLFEVIIPAYNCEETISKAVDALESSGLRDFSIIIINDGSTDQTEEKCLELVKRYHNIRYFKQKNKGVSAARNLGIRQSDAEYIIMFDADDIVDSDAFLNADHIIRQKKPDMLVYGMVFEYYYHEKLFRKQEMVYSWEGLLSEKDIQDHFCALYEANVFTSSCNKIIRRELVVDNEVTYDESIFLMEDFLFSLDCIRFCKEIYMLKEPIYRYHHDEGNENVYKRICRIKSLVDYMTFFKTRLEGHSDVLSKVYYMMLRQKLWMAKMNKIRAIAQDHVRSDIPIYTKTDNELDCALREGKYAKIRCHNLILQLRHRLANTVKRMGLYQKI